MIALTGYPRLIIAKPGTSESKWPAMCPAEFFQSFDNSICSGKSIGLYGDSLTLDDDYRYPFVVELALVTGLYDKFIGETGCNSNSEQLISAGMRQISGPQLINGFGGANDGNGTIFGVAVKTTIDYAEPITIEISESDPGIDRIEYGYVGNFGWGEEAPNSSDFISQYPDCPDSLVAEPGWRLDSEKIAGYRHLLASPEATIESALNEILKESLLAPVLSALNDARSSTLSFYSQLIYRYMPRKQSAFCFENAPSLQILDKMINGGDMGWAGNAYDYNPDYDY